MKRNWKCSGLFVVLALSFLLSPLSCKTKPNDHAKTVWKYGDVVSFQIWQPEYRDMGETQGWREFLIKSSATGVAPTANRHAKGWFIRQGTIEDTKRENRNFYLDFLAVKKDDPYSKEKIKAGEPFYLKTNTYCSHSQYCFIEEAHWPNGAFTQYDHIKFMTLEDNHEVSATVSPRRLEFYLKESSDIHFGKSEFRLYTKLNGEEYFLASYSKEDHETISNHRHKRIALVRSDIYETTDSAWKTLKKEFTEQYRSPQKDENNIKVKKCDSQCLSQNNPSIHLSTKEKLCSLDPTSLEDPIGTGFCNEHINRITKSYHAAYKVKDFATAAGSVVSLVATLFGQVEIAAAVGGATALAKATETAKEPTRQGLRFAYDACHEICYNTGNFNENGANIFYEEMGKLYDEKKEDKDTAFKKPDKSHDSAKWVDEKGAETSILVDMRNQVEALSSGTKAAPFIKGAVELLCKVLKNDTGTDHSEVRKACRDMHP